MLQSMVSNPRPTRAESTDVANAVWDGTDTLMLSNETAMGQYPVPSVATMARIIETAETGRPGAMHAREVLTGKQSGRFSRALSEAATFAAEEMGAKTIAVFTESGLMARRLSVLRPEQRIVALTPSEEVRNEDRKSTRLNSSHANISYAVFCLKKKNNKSILTTILYIQ